MEVDSSMNQMVHTFQALSGLDRSLAGGKGGTLSKLYQVGYPIPNGFVILPTAFVDDKLTVEAWREVRALLKQLRHNGTSFAVRSSALSEDSAFASFAGEFETVLDVHSDEMVREAIHTVLRSRHSQRVKAYSKAKGMDEQHEIAVVVQELIRADISGVLFTAEPVRGNRSTMLGNFVHGFGEELVSGEAEAYTFSLFRPKGRYQGPPEIKPYARKLYRLANHLENSLGGPQDIEWCIDGGKVYILQSRPITTLQAFDPVTFDWNSSHSGDYLWARQEPFPEVVTPSTWSLWSSSFLSMEIAGVPSLGNIGGRIYLNTSMPYSLMVKLGKGHKEAVELFHVIVSPLPRGAEVPQVPIAMTTLLKEMILPAVRMTFKQAKLKRNSGVILSEMPAQCKQFREEIEEQKTSQALLEFWEQNKLLALFNDLMLLLDARTEIYRGLYLDLKKSLEKFIGKRNSDHLISMISGGSRQLTTLGPLIGLSEILNGDINRDTYLDRYGHRHANENELAQPRPYEDPNWLQTELEEFQKNPVDIQDLLDNRESQYKSTWDQFASQHPNHFKKFEKTAADFIQATQDREVVRGEITRLVGVIRAFLLRAGDILNLGEDVFFLTLDELIQVLSGDQKTIPYLPARKDTLQKYKRLPPYPGWIRGRFNPERWASDPSHRGDFYDAYAEPTEEAESNILQGHPGSSGRVEGVVRQINSPEEGHLLRPGEILVAVTTNVGWTPLFPKAAAVITDIGAPLAHAAIVARELGIPAVVGCSMATTRLQTGDRVLVDGGMGTVEILQVERTQRGK